MISQIATKVTLSLAFLSAAMMFSPYPLVDQGKGKPGLIESTEQLVDSSKHFAADVSRDQVKMEQSDIRSRAQQVGQFRTAAADKIQDLRRTVDEKAKQGAQAAEKTFEASKETAASQIANGEQAASAGMHTAKEAAASAAHGVSEASKSVVHKVPEAAESAVHKVSEGVERAVHKASEAAGQAHDAVSDILITSAPQEMKQGSVDEIHSLVDAVVDTVKEEVKDVVQKTKQVGQGLKEKLESVTAHIRESTAWPEPEAISILAEGVWAPKEQKLLPSLDNLLGKGSHDPGTAAGHRESTVDEKLGIQGSGLVRKLKSYVVKSVIWQRLSVLSKQAWGYVPQSDLLSSKVAAIPARFLKLAHSAAVALQLGVLLWSLWTERFGLQEVQKIGSSSSGSRNFALVELACSTLTLTTFLAVFPWASSGLKERNEVQVLAGTLAEALRRLIWDGGSSKQKAVDPSAGIETSQLPPQGRLSSPGKGKTHTQRTAHKKSHAAPEGYRTERPAKLAGSMNLSAVFQLLTQVSAVGALCYHVYFLGSKFTRR